MLQHVVRVVCFKREVTELFVVYDQFAPCIATLRSLVTSTEADFATTIVRLGTG